ncbi:hypothetical protein K2X40_01755 [Candidatus Babeliales bacterium]|nr:hypothetical protein [Candidatus Babeliales bacterium]
MVRQQHLFLFALITALGIAHTPVQPAALLRQMFKPFQAKSTASQKEKSDTSAAGVFDKSPTAKKPKTLTPDEELAQRLGTPRPAPTPGAPQPFMPVPPGLGHPPAPTAGIGAPAPVATAKPPTSGMTNQGKPGVFGKTKDAYSDITTRLETAQKTARDAIATGTPGLFQLQKQTTQQLQTGQQVNSYSADPKTSSYAATGTKSPYEGGQSRYAGTGTPSVYTTAPGSSAYAPTPPPLVQRPSAPTLPQGIRPTPAQLARRPQAFEPSPTTPTRPTLPPKPMYMQRPATPPATLPKPAGSPAAWAEVVTKRPTQTPPTTTHPQTPAPTLSKAQEAELNKQIKAHAAQQKAQAAADAQQQKEQAVMQQRLKEIETAIAKGDPKTLKIYDDRAKAMGLTRDEYILGLQSGALTQAQRRQMRSEQDASRGMLYNMTMGDMRRDIQQAKDALTSPIQTMKKEWAQSMSQFKSPLREFQQATQQFRTDKATLRTDITSAIEKIKQSSAAKTILSAKDQADIKAKEVALKARYYGQPDAAKKVKAELDVYKKGVSDKRALTTIENQSIVTKRQEIKQDLMQQAQDHYQAAEARVTQKQESLAALGEPKQGEAPDLIARRKALTTSLAADQKQLANLHPESPQVMQQIAKLEQKAMTDFTKQLPQGRAEARQISEEIKGLLSEQTRANPARKTEITQLINEKAARYNDVTSPPVTAVLPTPTLALPLGTNPATRIQQQPAPTATITGQSPPITQQSGIQRSQTTTTVTVYE